MPSKVVFFNLVIVFKVFFVNLYFNQKVQKKEMEEHMLPCMNKQLFGIECPGCGTQRAIAFLLEGDFLAAFKIFPAIYTLALFFIFLLIHLLDKKRNYTKIVIAIAILNGVVILVSYAHKMYPIS